MRKTAVKNTSPRAARFRRSQKLLITGILLGAVFMLQCTDDSEGMDARLIGPLADDFGGFFRFTGEIDNTLTTTCGTVSAGSTTDSTGTDSSTSSSSSSSSETQTEFSINSFYQFRNGESLFLKYTYSSDEESFRITPTTSSVQTCFTTDFVNCNGSDGNPTCETTDAVSCGGSSTFIFTSIVPVLAFQATTGTIRWDEGFRLNSEQNKVVLADLEFDMVGTDGTSLFQGEVRCLNNE